MSTILRPMFVRWLSVALLLALLVAVLEQCY